MTCDVSSTPSSQVFSPLTLFECTVTNAQMLVESMADRELLRALKIANSLHTHIVGIMEPRYDRVCQRSDEHDACHQPPPPPLIINRRRHLTPTPPNQHELMQQPASKLAKIKMCMNGGALSPSSAGFAKIEPSVEPMGEALQGAPPGADEESSTGAAALGDYADENFLDEEDDCLLVEDSCEGVLGSGVSVFSGSTVVGQPPRRRQRRQARRSTAAAVSASAADGDDNEIGFSGADLSGLGIAGASGSQTDVASLCKSAIHLAYKEIKGNGPHLFDFSLPFSDPANSTAAEQVINRARQLQPQVDVPADVWWSQLCPIELNRQARSEKLWRQRVLMRRLRSKDSKLTRRQKSFELIAPTLNTEAFDKFRLILSRDYTSSDEEAEDFPPPGGASSSAAAAFAGAPLRVRELPWESEEMANMKRQLDAAYLESCATARQTEQLRRVSRGTGCVSARPPPADCPNWAIRQDDCDGGSAGVVGSILE